MRLLHFVTALTVLLSATRVEAQQFIDPADVSAVREAISVTSDAYQGTTRVKGPEIYVAPNRLADSLEMNFIHAPDGDELALYVSMITDDRGGSEYRSAASGGHELKVQSQRTKVRGCSSGGRYLRGNCSYLEGLWIIFDRADLANAAQNGFSFAVYGSGPRKEFHLPAAYFAAFKEQVDKIAPEPKAAQ